MSEMIIVNMNELAETVGVPSSLFTPPIPNAKPMVQYDWDGAAVERALMKLQETYQDPAAKLAFLGHVDVWVTLALAYGVEQACYFASPNHDAANTFTYVPLEDLPMGEPAGDVYFDYKIVETDDTVYMDYNVDDPSVQGHSFFHDSISKLVLPEIPQGKNLCLHGGGIYPVQWVVTNTYKKCCKSVFTAAHEDTAYTCTWSQDPRYRVGDKLPRKPLLGKE